MGDADEKEQKGEGERRIDAVFNGGKDRYKHANGPNAEFEWRDLPESVNLTWRCNEVCDSVNDDSREASSGDEEERVGEAVKSNDDDNSGDPTSGRRSHSTFGFKSRSREGTGCRIGTEDGSDGIRNANGD